MTCVAFLSVSNAVPKLNIVTSDMSPHFSAQYLALVDVTFP